MTVAREHHRFPCRALAAILLLMIAGPAQGRTGESAIGSINRLSGTVEIHRQGSSRPASIGMPLFERDVIRTRQESRVGILLRDDTLLAMGSESILNLRGFTFDPELRRYAVWIRFLKGTFAYISGIIAKFSPEAVRLETPEATISIRGTQLWLRVRGETQ